MSTFDLYDALIEAGTSEAKARKAADTVIAEPRLAKIETDVTGIKIDVAVIKSELQLHRVGFGVVVALQVAIFVKLFFS